MRLVRDTDRDAGCYGRAAVMTENTKAALGALAWALFAWLLWVLLCV